MSELGPALLFLAVGIWGAIVAIFNKPMSSFLSDFAGGVFSQTPTSLRFTGALMALVGICGGIAILVMF